MLGCIHNALTGAKTTGKTTGKTPDSLLALLSENPLHLGRLAKEKPFNHKVEINAALRQRRVSFATHSPLLFLAFY